jgi:NhaC family Na+:H+ antiporter
MSMIVFSVMGAGLEASGGDDSVRSIQTTIVTAFSPGLVELAAPLLVLVLVLRRTPALPALLVGVLVGALSAVFVQGQGVGAVLTATMKGYTSTTGNAAVDELLSSGGMTSMGNTVLLVLCAMSFGGVMECTGMLRTLAERVLRLAKTAGALVATTVLTSVGINIVAGDQYIAIVVPGRMYQAAYRRLGLHPKNLSRAIEDGGTITSALVPWNTCGAFMASTLMVPTADYLPYAVLCWLNPMLSIAMALLGIGLAPAAEAPRSE